MNTPENESLYGFNQETPEQLGSSPMPFGRVGNVKLVKVVYEPAKEGSDNMCLAFYFEDDQGRGLRHAEWPIVPAEVKERAAKRGDDPAKAVQKKARAQGVRIKHIATKVIPAERAVVPNVSSFEQYARAVIGLLGGALPAGPYWLKLLPNNKGYANLPPYTPFIARQEEGKDCPLSISPSEQKEINAAASGAGAGGSLEMPDDLDTDAIDDDLPF